MTAVVCVAFVLIEALAGIGVAVVALEVADAVRRRRSR